MAASSLNPRSSLLEVRAEDILDQISKYEEELKPFYYSDQIRLSHEIIERVKLILKKYHGKMLKDFSDFDYQIYTSKSNSLKEQTKSRLEHHLSGCIPEKHKKDLHKYSNERVGHYVISKSADERHAALLKDANNNPHKLFLIIADEAHWGITAADENKKIKSARDKYIDTWTSEYKNVIVLLVSATPYNLMTEETRLPLDKYCAKYLKTGELIAVTSNRDGNPQAERLLNDNDVDVTQYVGPKKRLHHVRWTEIFTSKLHEAEKADDEGEVIFQAILKSLVNKSIESYCPICKVPVSLLPCEKSDRYASDNKATITCRDPVYLLPCQESNGYIGVPDIIGRDDEATITLKGNRGRIHLFDSHDRQLAMKYVEEASIFDVAFMGSEDINNNNNFIGDFEIVMDYGEDVFSLAPVVPACRQKLCLYFDNSTCKIRAHESPEPQTLGTPSVLTSLPACNLFFVHKMNFEKAKEDKTGRPRYLSLNFFHTTMWNENQQEKLIRYDQSFEDLCHEVSLERDGTVQVQDDLLIADYCIFINALVIYNKLQIPDDVQKCTNTFLERVKSSTREIQDKFNEMKKKLPAELELNSVKLNKSIFEKVLMHHRKYPPKDVWERLFKACLFGDEKKIGQTIKEIGNNIDPALLNKKKQSVAMSYETANIVQDLLNFDSEKMQGKMQVIRVRKIDYGKRWYEMLTMARDIACTDMDLFEVLKDFGQFKLCNIYGNGLPKKYKMHLLIQRTKCSFEHCECDCYKLAAQKPESDVRCQDCRHHHNQLKILDDLNKLPCILILVEKGKMGDTFPESLKCLDLRVRCSDRLTSMSASPKNDPDLTLSTVVQGLGRLCRYSTEMHLQQMPYALVAKSMAEDLKSVYERSCGTIYCSFFTKGKIDAYIKDTRKSQQLEATKKNLHHTEKERKTKKNLHHTEKERNETNRILLDAEPQCGKTGTYCHVISQLWKIIYDETADDKTESGSENDSDSDDTGDSTDEDESPTGDDEEKWQYPYWQDMNKKKMKLKVTPGKYDPTFGLWRPGKKTVKPKMHCSLTSMKTPKKEPKEGSIPMMYWALSYHQDCTKCLDDCTSALYSNLEIKSDTGPLGPYRLSVPNLKRFSFLRDKVTPKAGVPYSDHLLTQGNDLDSWIFMPSAARAERGCFNLCQTMVGPRSPDDPTEVTKSYIQIIVVQQEEFQDYHKAWGRKMAILQLPHSMKYDHDVNVTCTDGGIGYSRRFIQKFAEHFDLPKIFVLDDNIQSFKEAQFEKGKVSRLSDSTVNFKAVPLFKVLKHLEDQFDKDKKAPISEFKPDPKCDPSLEPQALEAYCGPLQKYAVTGVLKDRPTAKRIRHAFAKVHVGALVLINIDAVKDKVSYEPMPVFEDLEFNARCDEEELWVVKFNRFIMRKKRMPSNASLTCYIWNEETELKKDLNIFPKEDSEVRRLKQWIQRFTPPMAKHCMVDEAPLNAEEGEPDTLANLFAEVNKISCGRRAHFISLNSGAGGTSGDDAERALTKFLTSTSGIGGFKLHVIAVSSRVCLKSSLKKRQDFKSLCQACFKEGFDFDIITSHKVDEFQVEVVLIVVEGEILNPFDEERKRTALPICRFPIAEPSDGDNAPFGDDDTNNSSPENEVDWPPTKTPSMDPAPDMVETIQTLTNQLVTDLTERIQTFSNEVATVMTKYEENRVNMMKSIAELKAENQRLKDQLTSQQQGQP